MKNEIEWVAVPREATPEMLAAGREAIERTVDRVISEDLIRDVLKAMIAVAPKTTKVVGDFW